MSKLYRSRRDSKLFGLCGGLAETLNVDSTLLRLVVVITTFFSGGTVIPIYVLACLVIPREPVFDASFGTHHHIPQEPPFMGNGSFRGGYAPNRPPFGAPPQQPQQQQSQSASNLDDMMKDIEKKAMQKELEELRAKLAKYEKGDN